MNTRKNIDAFSYLRVFATFGVILLHVAYSSYLLFKDSISLHEGTALLCITNALRFAVPCFVAVTGALLLNPEKEITIGDTLKKYMLRILVSLVVFSCIFWIFDMIMDSESFGISYILTGLKELYTADGWSHLWYMYLLIGIYALLPFYKMIAKHASDAQLKFLLAVYFIFICLLPLTRIFGLEPGFYLHTSTVYPLYLFLGYAIYNGKIRIKPAPALVLFILSEGAVVALNILSNEKGIENLNYLWNYQSPLTVIASASCFSLFCNIKSGDKQGIIKKALMSVDSCTLGIYLLHMLFVRLFLRYMQINPLNYGSVAGIILASVIFFIMTFIIIRLLKFIPGVKKII